MNAALMSTIPEKEEFCNYILKNYFHDRETRNNQIGLYILFQEFLYSIDENKINLENLDTIEHFIKEWKVDIINKQSQISKNLNCKKMQTNYKMYIECWDIWNEWASISKISSYRHLHNALKTIFLQEFESIPISYIMNTNGRKWT